MKKEEREFQMVRSPKSTKLFHLLLVLLLGTVSTRSLSRSSLSPTSFSRLHHFRHAVIPDLGLDLIRTKAISLSRSSLSSTRLELSVGKPSWTSCASPLAYHLRRSPPDPNQVISSRLSHLASCWVFFLHCTECGKALSTATKVQKMRVFWGFWKF